jgi:MFS family permease
MPERSAPRRAAAGRWSPSSASGSGCAEIGGLAFIYWTVALYQLGSILAGAITGIVAARRGLRLAMTVAALIYATGLRDQRAGPRHGRHAARRAAAGLGRRRPWGGQAT